MREAHNFVAMRAVDLAQVMPLEQELYLFPWSRGNFTDSLDSGYSAWLLRVGEQLAAYAVMLLAADEAQLLNISVAPSCQRSGLGSSLLDHLRRLAIAAGAARMFLEVRASNSGAQAFYSRHGFRRIGERRGYYAAAHGREHALVLELRL